MFFFFFSSRRRHTRLTCDWSSDVCSSDLGVNGGVALHENHARHIAGHEMRVLRAWCGCAALRGDQAVALKLTGELLKRRALKSRENERCLDGLKSGA